MNTTIDRKALAQAIHTNAQKKGFWDEEQDIEHYLMLAITELAEAIEAHRKGRRECRFSYEIAMNNLHSDEARSAKYAHIGDSQSDANFKTYIKDTLEDELCDAYIRLLDLMEGFALVVEYDLFDESVAQADKDHFYRGKPLTEAIFNICSHITNRDPIEALIHIEHLAHTLDFDLFWHIQEKMKYNATRPRLHGKKY